MQFSVLLSLYYKENFCYLRQSLDSIFNQTLAPDEVILVEDGPLSDELYAVVDEYVKRYPILKIVALEKNSGLGHALNEGLKYCSFDLVARMDTDDISKPDRFKAQVDIFESDPDIDVCGSWIDEFIGTPDNVTSQRRVPENHAEIVKYTHLRCPLNHPTVMYRKSKVLAVGGYSGFPEDYFLWVKLIMSGAKFYNIQRSLLFFRFSNDVITRRGGLEYAKNCVRTQYGFYRIGFLSFFEFFKNCIIRCTVSLLPNNIRSYIYRILLRNNSKLS